MGRKKAEKSATPTPEIPDRQEAQAEVAQPATNSDGLVPVVQMVLDPKVALKDAEENFRSSCELAAAASLEKANATERAKLEHESMMRCWERVVDLRRQVLIQFEDPQPQSRLEVVM